MLPKCFVIFVPLFCRLLPYQVRRNTYAAHTFRNVGTLPGLLVCHTQGLCWSNVCRTAYTFRIPGPVFKAGLIFHSFFFQAEDGIRDAQESRGLGDVYKRQA